MLAKPVIYDGGLQRQIMPGDVIAGAESLAATLATVGAGTLLAALLVAGILTRSGPVGGYTDTTDTAANIINAMLGNYGISSTQPGQASIPPGTTFHLRYINSVAQAMTLAAGTGVTLGSNVNVAASSVKDYLFTVLNGTPQQVYNGVVDGSTVVLTGFTSAQLMNLSPGMGVTGTGIAASSVILGINAAAGTITLNNATTAPGTVSLTFNPRVQINSLGQMLL